MAARELDERIAVRLRPQREARRGDELVELDRRRQIAGRKIRELDLARAVRALHRDGGIERGRDRDKLGRGIEMAKRAAERSAVAGLAVPDLQDRVVHQWAAAADEVGEFEIALAGHGADLERAV